MIRRSIEALGLLAVLVACVLSGCQSASAEAQAEGAAEPAALTDAQAGDPAAGQAEPAQAAAAEPAAPAAPERPGLPTEEPGPLRVVSDIDPVTPPVGVVAGFSENAFPPLMPRDSNHADAWERNDCMACHETGLKQAPVVEHAGMPPILVEGRCRTCHLPGE